MTQDENIPAVIGSAESNFAQPQKLPEPKRRKTSPRQAPIAKTVDDETPTAVSEDPLERLICITLHDSKEVPPGGQFVGVNGKQFWIKPGIKVRVPRYVVEALNNAVIGVPDIDDQMRVVGVRQVPRLPFTIHLDM